MILKKRTTKKVVKPLREAVINIQESNLQQPEFKFHEPGEVDFKFYDELVEDEEKEKEKEVVGEPVPLEPVVSNTVTI